MAKKKKADAKAKPRLSSAVRVPTRKAKRFYGHGIPRVDLKQLTGRLIVVEGADGSGRSTQINRLVEWLEGCATLRCRWV